MFLGYTIGRAKRLFWKKWELNRVGWDRFEDVGAFFDRHMLEVHHYLLSLLAEKTGR
jgi:hypothetical protein